MDELSSVRFALLSFVKSTKAGNLSLPLGRGWGIQSELKAQAVRRTASARWAPRRASIQVLVKERRNSGG